MNEKSLSSNRKSAGMRFLSIFLAFLLALAPVPLMTRPAEAAAVTDPWDGESLSVPDMDEDGTYLIRTGAELAWFADQVNAGRGELNARLENYIYLNDYNTACNWTMIGSTEEHPYRGHFDGNGQQVVYLRAEISEKTPEYRYAGLFGVIDGGTVENVTVLGKVLHNYASYGSEGSSNQLYTGSGGIAGYLKSGRIINCVNYARTTMEGDTTYRNAGGIVGICSGMVVHCSNEGKLSTLVYFAQNHIGGIAGLVYGVNAQVMNCTNHATVQGYFSVGGIAGAVKSGGEVVSSCNYGAVKGNSVIGGVVGRVSTTGIYKNGSEKECLVSNVYNLGTMSAYGTGGGSEMGGIAGRVGYENSSEEALPPMPVIQNAYTVVDYPSKAYGRRGAVIGYMVSGCYGSIYALSADPGLSLIGSKNDRAILILDEALLVDDAKLKSVGIVEKLGSAFTMSSEYDTENLGYPKLVWQGLPSALLSKVDAAWVELDSWLTETNMIRYGKNYSQIESLVKEYKDRLLAVSKEDELEAVITEAREKLGAVRPSVEADSELQEAIDNATLALLEYQSKLESQYPDLTESQLKQLDEITEEYREKLNTVASADEITLILRDGKDALENQIAVFEADKRLEEIRSDAIQELNAYRADGQYEDKWMFQISQVRKQALEAISQAQSSTDITALLAQAKLDIDAVIDQIPEEGAWDGKTLTEPALNENDVYQITSGSELAWFAKAVNTVDGAQGISGELCNDISLGFQLWTPIGNTSNRAFTGSFDGRGYTVRGLFIDWAEDYAGLFGCVEGDESRVIQNLTVSGLISVDGRVCYTGGIAGRVCGKSSSNRMRLINCHSAVNITQEQMKIMGGGMGGIAGYTAYVEVSNCSNDGLLKIPSEGKGGITYYAGGIIGNASACTRLQTSRNSGSVWCLNAAGGLVGGVSAGQCEFYSCYNSGEISAATYSGGLGGYLSSGGSTFKWCYSSGPVNLDQSGRCVGALFGMLSYGVAEYDSVYALKRSDSLGRTLVGGSADFSAPGKYLVDSELKSDDILNSLNGGGSCFIRDYLEYQSGYPILAWEMTLDDFKAGAISEIHQYVSLEDYSEENLPQVQAILADGEARIQAAATMEAVNAELTLIKGELDQVETLAGAAERRLQEIRSEAIAILENYVDLSVYREEEQALIRQYVADGKKYILQAEDEEEVERHLRETKENIDALPDAWQYYHQLDMVAAAQVDSYIMNIGEVVFTAYCKTAIQIARSGYENLTPSQKAMVEMYQTLLDAEAAWAALEEQFEVTEEDMQLAEVVDGYIDAIGEVTLDSGPVIQAARLAYDSLTEKQQALVSRPGVLTDAEAAYDALWAAQVAAEIAAIGEVTLNKKEVIFHAKDSYDALTESQKALVSDYPVLVNAISRYQNLLAAEPVISLIDEIGDVTLDSGNKILAAITAYNDLTADQQELVTNYVVLEAAAEVYDSLLAVQEVIGLIQTIGQVSQASGPAISAARSAYDSLTPEEKGRVTNRSVLENAEAAYAALKNPQISTGAETDRITGNPASVSELYGGGGSSGNNNSIVSGQGQPDGMLPGETAQAEPEGLENSGGSAETGSDEEAAGVLPDWLVDEIESAKEMDEHEKKIRESREAEERRTQLLILGIILGTCALLVGAVGYALRSAAAKRKQKKVYY